MKLHAYVSGRVQGVFFRANTKRTANRLGLTGWVKNLNDGRAEVTAEGERSHLGELLKFLYEGPPAASVESVDYEFKEEEEGFKTFKIRR